MIEVLYFGGAHCAPCKAMLPVVKRLVEGRSDITLAVYDIAKDGDIPEFTRHKVSTLPTTIVRGNGVGEDRATGARSEAQLRKLLFDGL